MPELHYVNAGKLALQLLDNKSLKWFKNESSEDYSLRLEDVQSDGTFVLFVCGVQVSHPRTESERGHISRWEQSLDQATVDKIEVASQFSFLADADFVIFQDSPKSRERHAKKNQ